MHCLPLLCPLSPRSRRQCKSPSRVSAGIRLFLTISENGILFKKSERRGTWRRVPAVLRLRGLFNRLSAVDKHCQHKECLLFPRTVPGSGQDDIAVSELTKTISSDES